MVAPALAGEIQLTDLSKFDLTNAKAQMTTYRGQPALKITEEKTEKEGGPGAAVAVVPDLQFRDGVIELDVSGAPSKDADPTARGFIGILFRIQEGGPAELIYLRPSNARADDQLARNHSVQYCSAPDWGWKRLRDETPGKYESYADMQPGEWTHMRIVVHGQEASLYVGNAEQPCLIVKDMKHGDSSGRVALWIGPGTEGYFRNLRITQEKADR